jgi:hypothetical protein
LLDVDGGLLGETLGSFTNDGDELGRELRCVEMAGTVLGCTLGTLDIDGRPLGETLGSALGKKLRLRESIVGFKLGT